METSYFNNKDDSTYQIVGLSFAFKIHAKEPREIFKDDSVNLNICIGPN